MKRRGRKICLLVLVLSVLWTVPAKATEVQEVAQAQAEALELNELQSAAGEYGDDFAVVPEIDLNDGIQKIIARGSGEIGGVLRKAVRSAVVLLAIVLLCGMTDGMNLGLGRDGIDAVGITGALAITAVAVADMHSLIGLGRETLDKMELFSKVLLPTITAAGVAGGAPSGAAARQVATMFFSDVLMTLISQLLIPLVYAYVAVCTAYAALNNEGLKRMGGLIKWVVNTVLTIALLAFVGYLTVSGVIAGTADAVSIKAAKFTVSSVVPVVGGILSDAAETVLAGASILRNAVGVFGMLTVLSMCVLPFLQLGVHYLVYRCTAALTATVSGGRISGLIDGIGGAFGLVLGMTGAGALLLLISMISAISVVTI